MSEEMELLNYVRVTLQLDGDRMRERGMSTLQNEEALRRIVKALSRYPDNVQGDPK